MGLSKQTKHREKWVAYGSKCGDTIVACGESVSEVEKRAKEQGYILPEIAHLIMTDIIDYPFTLPEEYKAIGYSHQKQPCLPVQLTNPITNKTTVVWGLVDTGASACHFPEKYAKAIGIDVKRGRPYGGPTSGGPCKGRFCHCHIGILAIKNENEIDFTRELITLPNREHFFSEKAPISLLGIEGFLEDYILTVDYPKQVFSIVSK